MDWLTVGEVSKQLAIPQETVRRYLNRHSRYLKVKKGSKSYQIAVESVKVLENIRRLYLDGKLSEEVDQELVARGQASMITISQKNDDNMSSVQLSALDDKLSMIATMLMSIDERLKEQENFKQVVSSDLAYVRKEIMSVHSEMAAAAETFSNSILEVKTDLSNSQSELKDKVELILSRVDTYGKKKRWWNFKR